ncbi:MAG: hypothetical protein KF681_08670 [Bdellovibrionaceae bacterium]|nr:hypothetical protein [Pseudobdellovibrionaceae bacterium]
MTKMILAAALMLTSTAMAHDEGHGPKLSDTGKYGGLVSGVVAKADAKKGSAAALVHKAELVRSADGTIRVYFYDQKMVPLDMKSFDTKGSATLAAKVKGKYKDSGFALELKDNAFTGKMPKIEGKPYDIDVTVKEGNRELLTAFDNLD